MPPKHYRDVYLREETYQKLMQLKAVLGKRSVNDVVEELLKCVTVNTVSSPVSTGKVTVSTVKPTVSTGEPPVSTVSSPVNTVKHGEDPSNGELLERLEALEKSVVELRDAVNALAKEFKDFTRKQQDLLNTYTSKTDQVLQRFSQLIEVAESRDERLDKVVELLQKLVEFLKQGSAKVSEEKQRVSGKSARRREDKCENLKKELVLFESEIYGKIRDRDAFFTSLERDCEAIIIEGARERVAVEKSFWQQFLEKLSKIGTDDDKIKKILDNVEYKLFKTLRESALILFDAVEKKWKPVTSIATSTENKHNKEGESWLLQYAPESEET